jgi:hypothetical protein
MRFSCANRRSTARERYFTTPPRPADVKMRQRRANRAPLDGPDGGPVPAD